jgi:hypothetical protein
MEGHSTKMGRTADRHRLILSSKTVENTTDVGFGNDWVAAACINMLQLPMAVFSNSGLVILPNGLPLLRELRIGDSSSDPCCGKLQIAC